MEQRSLLKSQLLFGLNLTGEYIGVVVADKVAEKLSYDMNNFAFTLHCVQNGYFLEKEQFIVT